MVINLPKVKNIKLSWFRGAGKEVLLDTDSKSVVVYGLNGSGKSTFPDAFEYLYRKDVRCAIKHLRHEYSGSRQEKGVRNTHAGENTSKLSFIFENDNKVNININNDGSNEFVFDPEGFENIIEKCEADRLILRQDEVADFINSNKGEKYSVLLPLLGLTNYETIAENFSRLKYLLIEESGLQRNEQRLEDLMENVNETLPSLEDTEIQKLLRNISSRYLHKIPEDNSELIEKLKTAIKEKITVGNFEIKRHEILNQINNENITGKVTKLLNNQEKAIHDIDSLLGHKIEILQSSSEFLSKMKDQDKVICPSCGCEVLKSNYITHVESELKRLTEARKTYENLQKSKRLFSNSINQIFQKFEDTEINKWLNLDPQSELKELLIELRELEINELMDISKIEKIKSLKPRLERFNQIIKKELEMACPETKELINDEKIINAIECIPEIKILKKRIFEIKTLLSYLDLVENSIRQKLKEKTEYTISQISNDVMDMWNSLHPDESIENIHLNIPDSNDRAIDICLKFHGIEQLSPRLTLSEGYRNSLGLCIFLTLTKKSGNDQPIILDDIITSLDREHRGLVAELLIKNFSDRQILLFTHDREWFSELRLMFPHRDWKFLSLKPWEGPEIGIQWVSGELIDFNEAISLINVNLSSAGNRTRGIMDTNLPIIAEKIRVKLPYLRGDKNDQRGAIDFLEYMISEAGNKRKFRKKTGDSHEVFLDAVEDWKTTKKLLIAWANRASHRGSITKPEVEKLIEMCEKSINYLECPNCNSFVWKLDNRSQKRSQCDCGLLQWRYGG